LSPTPTNAFAACYDQEATVSYDTAGNWGYCTRPGFFWFGMKADTGSMADLNMIRCCKPTYNWQNLKC